MPAVEHRGDTELRGNALVGREIIIRCETGLLYDAVIVQYYEDEDEHKIVYRRDDGVEIARLSNRRWALVGKKSSKDYKKPILDGAIIRFLYEGDGLPYEAMIYDHNAKGCTLKVAYLCEHSTDILRNVEWHLVRSSPCSLDTEDASE